MSFITPLDQLFVISHLEPPGVFPAPWRLTVSGLVARDATLDLADLQRYPQASLESVHHCAGNPLAPSEASRQAANLKWSGVWLRDVLDDLGVRPGARFVWSDGLDSGSFAGETVEFYRKDLPLARVAEDVMLATGLNGQSLGREHGGPLRLVVPGYYGTNSVKWLLRLTLAAERAQGLFTTRLYNDSPAGGPLRPVWEMAPMSMIAVPAEGARVFAPVLVRGWTWGDREIRSVELSDDGGRLWSEAFVGRRRGREWQPWFALWVPSKPGRQTIQCRATDAAGATQPHSGARNGIHRIEIEVVESLDE
ncbi:molybdopterin-dependent oxidoreductase [Burkholderia plantarii]|uniref:Oxidoreductase, molybdopterin binding protein n=1 Tax=Burkholderia plantarii TaxID=41899 RepID=A0A0B6S9A9_BURPL|nr:molybdopterin-dependent oxidoreductase [Burkholderia plantarii]AJK49840.1 oxidoreductase, molybdopterin binding protein [Burkholderia plantarii]